MIALALFTGTYKTAAGPSLCQECPDGTYNTNSGSQTKQDCLLCPEDKFCPVSHHKQLNLHRAIIVYKICLSLSKSFSFLIIYIFL